MGPWGMAIAKIAPDDASYSRSSRNSLMLHTKKGLLTQEGQHLF
jgi:hypothetical protein